MDEKPIAVFLNKALSSVENFGVFLGCLLLWGIVLLIGAQVVIREVFSLGLPWVDEIGRYFHIVLVGLALGYILRKGTNVDIRLLVEFFPARGQYILGKISTLAIFLSSAFIVWGGINLIQRAGASRLPASGMEVRYFLLPTAIGFGILALEALRQLLKRSPPDHPASTDSGGDQA